MESGTRVVSRSLSRCLVLHIKLPKAHHIRLPSNMSEFQSSESAGRADVPISSIIEEAASHREEATALLREQNPDSSEQQIAVNQTLEQDDDRQDDRAEIRYLRIVRYRGIVPLPYINCVLLWRHFGPRDFRAAVKRASRILVKCLVKILQTALCAYHIYRLTSEILKDGSMLTYSEKYFGDILGYCFRNYPQILERHCEIARNNAGATILLNSSWRTFLYDLLALNISAKYRNTGNDVVCELDRDSLIYKFSDAVTKSAVLDWLPSASVTIFTVSIYLIYFVVALVLKLNVAIVVGINFYQRLLPIGRFFGNLFKSLWYQTSPTLY